MKIRGEVLKAQRNKLKLTLDEMEVKTGISKRQLSRWEAAAESTPNAKNEKKLKTFFGINIDLYSPEEEATDSTPHAEDDNDLYPPQQTGTEAPQRPFYAELSGKTRNDLFLAARRYNVDQKTIVELSPLLFTIISELSLRYWKDKIETVIDAVVVAQEFGDFASDEHAWREMDAINERNVFHNSQHKEGAFWEYLKFFTRDEKLFDGVVKINRQNIYGICIDDVKELIGSGNAEEIRSILCGLAPISKMPAEMLKGNTPEDRARRVQWIDENTFRLDF